MRARIVGIGVCFLGAAAGAVACGGGDPGAAHWAPLIESTAWAPTDRDRDPLSAHRPATEYCSPAAWGVELDSLEVDTGECNYLSLSQPALETIAAGDEIRLRAWWQTLASEEPAFGHLAIFAGATVLFDEHVPIPSPASAREVVISAPHEVEAGTPIIFHLHNHGHNSWNLETISVLKNGN